MEGYEFEAKVDDAARSRVVAMTFAPGEAVRPTPNIDNETSRRVAEMASSNGGELQIRSVVVDGSGLLQYEFEGFEGRFGINYVTDKRDLKHCYGALVSNEGQTWLVALDGVSDRPKVEGAMRIGGAPEKFVGWNQGLFTEEDLAAFASPGMAGEFTAAEKGDGSWSLVASPWTASIGDEEQVVARAAVREAQHEAEVTKQQMIRAKIAEIASPEIAARIADFGTHRREWREAIADKIETAEVRHPDVDDKGYWRHQLKAFDNACEALDQLLLLVKPDTGKAIPAAARALNEPGGYRSASADDMKASWMEVIDAATTKRRDQGQLAKDGQVERLPSFQFQVQLGELKELSGLNHNAPGLKLSEPVLETLKVFSGAIRQPEFQGGPAARKPTGIFHTGREGIAHLVANFGEEKTDGGRGFQTRALHLDVEALKKHINSMRDPATISARLETFSAAYRDSILRTQAKPPALLLPGRKERLASAEIGN